MASSRTFPLSFPAVNGGDGSAFRQLQQISEFIGVKKPRAMTTRRSLAEREAYRDVRCRRARTSSTAAPTRATAPNRIATGIATCRYAFVISILWPLISPKITVPRIPKEQSRSHSTRGEQQSAEHNPHSGREDDGNPRTMGRCSVRHTHNNSTAMMRFLSGRRRSRTTQSRRWHVERGLGIFDGGEHHFVFPGARSRNANERRILKFQHILEIFAQGPSG